MNDLLYYEPIAQLLAADAAWQAASTQARFGYLTFASSFHWNLQKLIGDVSPTYRLAPASLYPKNPDIPLPYLNDKLALYVRIDGLPGYDWPTNQTVIQLANVHADGLDSVLRAASADVAATLLSNLGHTVVIRVILAALRQARRRTVDPGVLEEALSTLCLLSHRRYEGRIPELAVCFGHSRRRPGQQKPAVSFGRHFLDSKKSAVLLKGGALLLHCLGNGRVVEVVDLDSAPSGTVCSRVIGPLGQISALNYSYDRAAVTAILTRHGEVLVAIGARICFSWDATSWRLYPAQRLADELRDRLIQICTRKRRMLAEHLARHVTTIALTLREERLGALLVVSSSEDMIKRLIGNRQANISPVEALYSRLFVGHKLCDLSPQLMCNAAALDGAVVLDGNGVIRGIGCIFETGQRRTATEGARTRAALFASKDGVVLKISQDGEMSVFRNGKCQASLFSPIW